MKTIIEKLSTEQLSELNDYFHNKAIEYKKKGDSLKVDSHKDSINNGKIYMLIELKNEILTELVKRF